MRSLLPIAASLAFCALVPAQDPCAGLTVTGDGSPGSDITFEIATDGSGMAIAFVLIGKTAADPASGHFSFPGLDLGLEPPFIPLPLGRTDMDGDVSRTFTVPMGLNLPQLDLLAQAMTVEFSFMFPFGGMFGGGGGVPGGSFGGGSWMDFFMFTFCTSDLVPFQIGG